MRIAISIVAAALCAGVKAQTISNGASVNSQPSGFSPGANIVSFGADQSGVDDSTAAVQAANDSLSSSDRVVYCPSGIYKVSPLIFLDPPGNLRGADGVHGPSYSVAASYIKDATVNFNGIAYISLQAGNVGNTPNSSPSWWRLFAYDSAATYAPNDVVSYSPIPGLPPVPWVATQQTTSNLPALGSSFWKPTQIPPTISNSSAVFVGSEGGGQYFGFTRGCVLNFTSNNNTAIWIGSQWGNVVKNVTINGCGNGGCLHTGLQPTNGVGIGISGGPHGANSTTIDHVGIVNFYTLIKAEYNNGETGFAAENTFTKVWGSNCYYGIVVAGGDSFINSVNDPSLNCINAFVSKDNNLLINGGNWTQNFQASASFGLSGASVVSASIDPSTALYSYTFTAMVAAPDAMITGCGLNIGNCVYNSWVLVTPHFGLIPMTMTGWDSSSNIGTFKTLTSWGAYFGQNQNALLATALQSDVQGATTIYAIERATFVSGGNVVTATSGWIENNSRCATLASTASVVSLHAVRWNGEPGLAGASGPMLYCQQSFPMFDVQPGGRIKIEDSYFHQNSRYGSSAVVDMLGVSFYSGDNNQNGDNSIALFRPIVRALSKTGGHTRWGANPFFPYPPFGQKFGEPYIGWLPAPWTSPQIDTATFGLWKTIAGQVPGNYPNAVGNVVYDVFDQIGVGANVLAQSQHQFASYGQNLTTSNVPGLSLSWQGQNFVVLADANTLKAVYPGLGVLLDNGSGDVHYVVSGVFPEVSLDIGVHPGYFTVINTAGSGAPYLLTGSSAQSFTASKIDQDAYSWRAVGGGTIQ